MKFVTCNPIEYHQARFNPALLPDFSKAGPVSASILSDSRNPIKFLTNPRKAQTDDMNWGNLVDCLWLTPELYDAQYAILPKDMPKDLRHLRNAAKPSPATLESIRIWDAWDLACVGKITITQETLDKAHQAVKMLNHHPVAREIFENSHKQAVMSGECPYNDLGTDSAHYAQAKLMMDLWGVSGRYKNVLSDLKQCHYVAESGMQQAIRQFEYHMKMAFYRDCLRMGHEDCDRAILIFQSSVFPFEVKARELSQDLLDLGSRIARERFRKMCLMDPKDITPFLETDLRFINLSDQQLAWESEQLGEEDPDGL